MKAAMFRRARLRLDARRIRNCTWRFWSEMDGDANIAALGETCRFITSAPAAYWVMIRKTISSHYVRYAIKEFIGKSPAGKQLKPTP